MNLLHNGYPGDFNYHADAKAVVQLFDDGLITETQAMRFLQQIEEIAYEVDQNAEPDGDITFCVANALHEIRGEK